MQMNKHNDESLKENNHLRALARAYLVYCLRDIDGVPRRLEKKNVSRAGNRAAAIGKYLDDWKFGNFMKIRASPETFQR